MHHLREFIYMNKKVVLKEELIRYYKTSGRTIIIRTFNATYYAYDKLRKYILDAEPYFYACHNYLLVNLNTIVSLNENTIYFDNGDTIKLGRDNFRQLYKRYIDFCNKKETVR
jgi:DNA-binding LytR/AlgR family response regulator